MKRERTILLTRSAEANESVLPLFAQHGFTVLSFPTIEILDPESWNECDTAIENLQSYDGVVFTSANSVERFFLRIDDVAPGKISVLESMPIYSVGEKTSARLRDLGMRVALTPDSYNADDLVESILSGDIAGKVFLFPKGDRGMETVPQKIRAHGARVDEVVVYRNVMPPPVQLELIRRSLRNGGIDVVTFFSPSSIQNFLHLVELPETIRFRIAVIGPTTAKAALDAGLRVDIMPEQSTAESLAEAIARHFKQHTNHTNRPRTHE